MAKFVVFFSYSSDAWARLIDSPGDRGAAVQQMIGSVGGSLESMYWMFGSHDGMAIVDVPDSVSIAAVNVATLSTGTITHVQTQELLTQQQLSHVLQRARDAAQVFRRPGED
jgi:uncharacterized protein with GYD domain